jgi:hypothetical protein
VVRCDEGDRRERGRKAGLQRVQADHPTGTGEDQGVGGEGGEGTVNLLCRNIENSCKI